MKNEFIDGIIKQFHEYEDEYYRTPDVIFIDMGEFHQNILMGEGQSFFNWMPEHQLSGVFQFMGWTLIPTPTNSFTCVFYEKRMLDEYIARLRRYMRDDDVVRLRALNTRRLFANFYKNPDDVCHLEVEVKKMMLYKDAVNRYINVMGKFKGE